MEYTIRVGGEAGQGLQSIGNGLAKILSRYGFNVFTHQDYMSRVRGGHNFYQIRFADVPISASRDRVDLLLAMNQETIELHRPDLNDGGRVIYDAAAIGKEFSGPEFLNIPFAKIIEEQGAAPIMANSVAVGAILGLFGLDIDLLAPFLKEVMHKKGDGVITTNIAVAQAGLDYVHQHYPDIVATFKVTKPQAKGQLLINGNQAIGLGALVSGCKFFAAYPMTPSTSIMQYLAAKASEYGLIVEQAEDEIAAINMALGASFGGVRAMTATSGGGFALMTEGLSLAGMTETPIVIVEAQRPGPATGLPTRTEQGDLFFVIYGGHGEFPRVVLTPGTPEQALYLTNKAFHLAEKYQIPVIVQSDQYLADTEWTYPGLLTEPLLLEDFRLREQALQGISSYQRYAPTASGVSPLAVPGASHHLVAVDSDEHDADGHIIEDSRTRIAMVDKRVHQKMPLIRQEIAPPTYHGDERPQILLVGYGSTYGVLKEVQARLAGKQRTGLLHFTEVWPFPLLEKFDFLALLKQAAHTICIENNVTGQFADLMRMETGFMCDIRINKYDGRPFLLDTLLGEINEHLRGL